MYVINWEGGVSAGDIPKPGGFYRTVADGKKAYFIKMMLTEICICDEVVTPLTSVRSYEKVKVRGV